MENTSSIQRKDWVFTINNPEALLDFDVPRVAYAVYQMEIGDEGTPHFQGFLQLSQRQKMSWIKNNIPGFERSHLEPIRGTPDEARNYAMKADTRLEGPWEHGVFTPSQQGKRNDLIAVKSLLDKNATDIEVADAYFGQWCRYHKSFEKYRGLRQQPRDWDTDAILCIGHSGTGKSTWCNAMCPGAYWKQPGGDWWDDYRGEEVAIMDEFTGWIPYNSLLRVLDSFPLLVQTKGGQAQLRVKWVLLTANRPPETWYSSEVFRKNSLAALTRRITRVLYFQGKPGTPSHAVTQFDSYQEWLDSVEYREYTMEICTPDFQ